MRIGIIAALPGELKPLVKGWERLPIVKGSGIRMWQTQIAGADVVAVCAGMGSAAARRAFTAAEFLGPLDAVYSVGWAGATDQQFVPEACYVVSQVIDAQTGERFECALQSQSRLRLVTAPHVANAMEKQRLWRSYEAGMVDMEAVAVARLAQMREIPFSCVKAISDEHSADLPDLNPFIDAQGQMKMGAFLGYIALHPRYLPALVSLGMHSAVASKHLAKALKVILQGKDLEVENRLGLKLGG